MGGVSGDSNEASAEIAGLRRRLAEVEAELAELRRSEVSVREAELRLRSLVEQASDPFFCYECDPPFPTDLPISEQVRRLYDCVLIECNEACAKAYGAGSVSEVIGRKLTDLFAARPGSLNRLFEGMIRGGYRTVDGEGVEELPDGTQRTFLNNAHGVIDDGKLLRIWGTFREVTGQRAAEEALRREREFTEAAWDAQRDTFFLFERATGKAIRWNRAFREITGYTDAEIAELPAPASYYDAEDLERAVEFLGRLPETDSGTIELDLISKDGRRVPTEYCAAVVSDARGAPRYLISIGRDVAERKKANEEIRRHRERLRVLVENIPSVVWSTDAEGNTDYIGANVAQVYGFSQEEIYEGGPEVWLGRIHPDDADAVRRAFAELMENGTTFDIEYRIQRKDGEWIWLSDRATTVGVEEGKARAFGVFTDVTERRNMQAQLAQADRLSSLGMLAAGVAHEINNPLTYISYSLESLTEDLPGLLDAMRAYQATVGDRFGAEVVEKTVGSAATKMSAAALSDIQDRLRDALDGANRIREIAQGLGTFSRVERDQLVPVDLEHVIEVALHMCFNEIKYRARVVKDYGATPTVIASEGRLSQVFLNLLVNAAHAIDEGDLEGNEIRVRTWTEGGSVWAEVRDTGAGIAPEHLGRVFEPFFTTKAIGVGSGLGLPISKGLVESYDGTITVESEVGKGSAFTLRLPIGVEQIAPVTAATSDGEEDPVRGRILIVDDEDATRAVMARMLRAHETVEAESGEAARQLLARDQDFELILCDVMMPEVSGVDLHAWLSEENPDLANQLIFVTGGAFTPRTREYLNHVDNARLEKPFDVIELRKTVASRICELRAGRS